MARDSTSSVMRRDVAEGIAALGAVEGDVLYMRCGMQALGIRSRDLDEVFLGGVRDVIGSGGTLIGPAFVKASLRWSKDLIISNRDTVPYTGAFSKLLLRQPDAYRSNHPTHSFVGIGPRAEEILGHHPADGSCFEPMRKIAEIDGLMAVVGCVESSPGFSTVHLAQHDLGLTQQHWTKYFLAVRQGGPDGPVFHPIESPGCSDNFGVFYKNYVESGNFRTATVGNAWSIAVRAKEAYDTEIEVLGKNPLYPLCEKRDCISCYILRGYNKRAIPGGLLRYLVRRLRR